VREEARRLGLFFGWEVEGGGVVFEMAFMGAVAKGFVLRAPAAAERDDVPSCQAVYIAIPVDEFEISFQFE
jgi:hypothetical protein